MPYNAKITRPAVIATFSVLMALSGCGEKPEPQAEVVVAPAPELPAFDEAVSEYLVDYQRSAENFVAGVDRQDPLFALSQSADYLLTLAEQVVPAYVERKPYCTEMLTAALQIKTRWQTDSVEQLKADFHEEKGLPANDKTASCHHMKDMITYPAIALAMMQKLEPDMTGARREIDEVLAHARLVAAGK